LLPDSSNRSRIRDVATTAPPGRHSSANKISPAGQRSWVLVLVAGRAQRVARRLQASMRPAPASPGQQDGTGDDLQRGPVHGRGRQEMVHGAAGDLQRVIPAAEREQRLGLVDGSTLLPRCGTAAARRGAHRAAAGGRSGPLVLSGPSSRWDSLTAAPARTSSALWRAAISRALGDQLERTAAGGGLLTRLGVVHGSVSKRVRLAGLVGALPRQSQGLFRVGPARW